MNKKINLLCNIKRFFYLITKITRIMRNLKMMKNAEKYARSLKGRNSWEISERPLIIKQRRCFSNLVLFRPTLWHIYSSAGGLITKMNLVPSTFENLRKILAESWKTIKANFSRICPKFHAFFLHFLRIQPTE